jgi:hypothetical protein
MESTDPSEALPEAKRRRPVLIVAIGVIAGTLLVALVVAVTTNDNGDDRSDPRTTTPADQAAGTTAGESGSATTRPADTTTSTAPDPQQDTLADGAGTVGEDIQPGRYIAADINGNGCAWARLADAAGETVIAAETDVANQAIVDILDTDAAFRSNGCGTWAPYTAPDPPPSTTIDPGDWVVGEQIQPGAYRVPQAATCTWTRASGFEHTAREVTQTERTNIALEGPYLVTLTTGERFTTRGCDTWTKAD